MFTTLIALALLPLSLAIQVTTPATSADLAIGGASTSTQVQWQSVVTDPTTFAMVLVNPNNAILPNSPVTLNANVSTSSGSLSVTYPNGGWPTGQGFQINFVQSTTSTNTILAQSGTFNITASTSGSSSSSSSASTVLTSSTSTTASDGTQQTGTSTSIVYSGNASGAIPGATSSAASAATRIISSVPVFPAMIIGAAMTVGSVVIGSMVL